MCCLYTPERSNLVLPTCVQISPLGNSAKKELNGIAQRNHTKLSRLIVSEMRGDNWIRER
jgi:hypothetical protein